MAGWLFAWITFFLLLYMLSRTREGHALIYYGAWMLVALLIVTHGNEITSLLSGYNAT
jgi:hypothetical protein